MVKKEVLDFSILQVSLVLIWKVNQLLHSPHLGWFAYLWLATLCLWFFILQISGNPSTTTSGLLLFQVNVHFYFYLNRRLQRRQSRRLTLLVWDTNLLPSILQSSSFLLLTLRTLSPCTSIHWCGLSTCSACPLRTQRNLKTWRNVWIICTTISLTPSTATSADHCLRRTR